jgi:hypothetical protein
MVSPLCSLYLLGAAECPTPQGFVRLLGHPHSFCFLNYRVDLGEAHFPLRPTVKWATEQTTRCGIWNRRRVLCRNFCNILTLITIAWRDYSLRAPSLSTCAEGACQRLTLKDEAKSPSGRPPRLMSVRCLLIISAGQSGNERGDFVPGFANDDRFTALYLVRLQIQTCWSSIHDYRESDSAGRSFDAARFTSDRLSCNTCAV